MGRQSPNTVDLFDLDFIQLRQPFIEPRDGKTFCLQRIREFRKHLCAYFVRQRNLADLALEGERACGSLLQAQTKSTMTHHWRVLRDSGVIWQRPSGRENLLSLRRDDLEARFPGLLHSLLGALEHDPVTEATTAQHLQNAAK